jgi:hypothetical protein
MAFAPLGSGIPGFGSFPSGTTIQSFKTGGLAGSTTSVKPASTPCSMVNFMAPASNTGKVYIGPDTSVIKEDGTTNYTTGWELAAGQQTGWLPAGDVSMFSYICTNATDDLIFWAV